MMMREVGSRDFDVSLLGDSNPRGWQNALKTPLDPRHPARHSIWTSVLEVIQDRVYRESRQRVDTVSIYIRNAVGDPDDKPDSRRIVWNKREERSRGA